MVMMLLQDILKVVIPLVVGAILTWLTQKIGAIRLRTSRRKFWSGESREVNVVYGTREMDMTPFEKAEALKVDILNVVNVNDVISVVKASSYLHRLLSVSVKTQDEIESTKKGNFLIIGGPIANNVTKEFFGRINTSYEFNIVGKDVRQIVNKTGSFVASAKFDKDFNLIQDVAWFYRGKNPYDEENVVIIAAGCFGYGTEAVISYLISDEFYKQVKNKRIDTMEGVLEEGVKNGKTGQPNLISSVGL